MAKVRLIKHEAVPKCGSFEVRFADGRPSDISIGMTLQAVACGMPMLIVAEAWAQPLWRGPHSAQNQKRLNGFVLLRAVCGVS